MLCSAVLRWESVSVKHSLALTLSLLSSPLASLRKDDLVLDTDSCYILLFFYRPTCTISYLFLSFNKKQDRYKTNSTFKAHYV